MRYLEYHAISILLQPFVQYLSWIASFRRLLSSVFLGGANYLFSILVALNLFRFP